MAVYRMFRDALLAPPEGRFGQRCLLSGVLSLAGSLAMAGAASSAIVLAGIPLESIESPDTEPGLVSFVGAVVLAPLVETLLLAGTLALLPARWGLVPRAVAAGVAWGVLHGVQAPVWFFGTLFPFFVFSCGYLVWRPVSFRHGFAAAALPHALQNLIAMTLINV